MLIAGNWKMNTHVAEAARLARGVVDQVGDASAVQVVVCPPYVSLDRVAEVLRDSQVRLGAQNLFWENEGAYTGAISAGMLQAVGCAYVIVGHSERRQYFGETDETVRKKVEQAFRYELTPILCIGETLEEREAGEAEAVVQRQLDGALGGIGMDDPVQLVVAYEPVWAIGTGQTATPEQAGEMHQFLRGRLVERFGEDVGGGIELLYGGSMKPANAADLFAQTDVNGGLIGGASLDAESFAAIVQAATAAA